MQQRKKLIEVALPLEAINKEGALRKRKAPGGYPTAIHKWWAQRPVAAARAVIFAQMVDDPSTYVDALRGDPTLSRRAHATLKARLKAWEEARIAADNAKASEGTVVEPGPRPTLDEVLADLERQRLFQIIEDLVTWENTTNETALQAAREEIKQSWRRACADNANNPCAKELSNRHELPAFQDPFAGGGTLPLEAQRLGLEAHASDLNPVAVLINKAMIEIPPKFAGRPPVNPKARSDKGLIAQTWTGARGLAEDVRYYGQWMRDEAEKRIGALYPPIEVTAEMAKGRPDLKPYVGRKLTVIAWLWARTVKSPNPAFAKVDVPLASTFMLSTKAGKEAYVEPVIENGGYRFTVKVGKPKNADATKLGTTAGKRSAFRCLMSGVPLTYDHIRAEGQAGRMGTRLMAIVAEGDRGRVYLSPTLEHEAAAQKATPKWKPEMALPDNPRDFKTPNYGLMTFGDLFTPRQLVALTTFSDLVGKAMQKVRRDAANAGLPDDAKPLRDGGTAAPAYAEAIGVYLALAIDRMTDYNSSIATWRPKDNALRSCFAKQAIPMTWDFAEGSPFGDSSAAVPACINAVAAVLQTAVSTSAHGVVVQQSAAAASGNGTPAVMSTDPPYFDNIGYADLSDFFYVWLRRNLRSVFPDLFVTLAVPKAQELVATPYRHGTKEKAEAFFLSGMTDAMRQLASRAHAAYPITIYYAFKQAETDAESGTSSTGWETFLGAVLQAGLTISGTWPLRTEGDNRQVGIGANALASSIVLVCRRRAEDAPNATRRELVAALKTELPAALRGLQQGNIAPVDLAQAAIGPGMAVYTRYAKVIDAAGGPVSVRDALALINQVLDETLAEQEGDFDPDTRWALTWFDQQGFDEGEFGVAEQLSKAKNTSVEGMVEAGIIVSKRGKVRLLKPDELPTDWDPATDRRLTAWETVHHLVRVLESGGEAAAAELAARLGAKADVARELAYRLFSVCERKKRAQEGTSYNGLVQSWGEIQRLANGGAGRAPAQAELFDGEGE